MTTITIDPEIKSELLKIAAQLQMEGKKKVNYNDAIKYLLSLAQAKKKDQERFLQACEHDAGLEPKQLVQELMRERNKDEQDERLDILNKIKGKLQTYFQNKHAPEIISIYVFGSRVSGVPSQHSDLDIGILLRQGVEFTNDSLFRLMDEIEHLVAPQKPDVKILNELPVRVVHDMLKQAQLVYCADNVADADFREVLYRKYFDLKPLLNTFIDAL